VLWIRNCWMLLHMCWLDAECALTRWQHFFVWVATAVVVVELLHSVRPVPDSGTACPVTSSIVRLSTHSVVGWNISFLMFLFLDISIVFLCFLYFSVHLEVFYLVHIKNFLYNTIQYCCCCCYFVSIIHIGHFKASRASFRSQQGPRILSLICCYCENMSTFSMTASRILRSLKLVLISCTVCVIHFIVVHIMVLCRSVYTS